MFDLGLLITGLKSNLLSNNDWISVDFPIPTSPTHNTFKMKSVVDGCRLNKRKLNSFQQVIIYKKKIYEKFTIIGFRIGLSDKGIITLPLNKTLMLHDEAIANTRKTRKQN